MSAIESNSQSDENLYELRRAVYILAEQIGRLQADRQAKAAQDQCKPSLSQRFVDQVSLMGVADALKSKRLILKVIWLFIFVALFSITVFLVYRVVDEYRQNPTATKVTVIRNATYSYPTIVLCLDTWFSLRKATDIGFSRRAVEFALNYFLRFEDVQLQTQTDENDRRCRNWQEGQQDFLDTFAKMNLSSLLDFYDQIALDTVQGEHFNASSITFDCKGCPAYNALKKVVVDRGVCYQVPLMAETGKLRGSDGMWRLFLNAPNLTEGLGEAKPYWRLYINTQLGQIQPTSMFLSVDKSSTTAITISEQRFQMVTTKSDPCVHKEQDKSTAVQCATKCLSDDSHKRLGCRLLSLETEDFRRSPSEYCNRCSWRKSIDDRSRETMDNTDVQLCLDNCPHECETWTYDGTVDKHLSSSLDAKMKKVNNQSNVKFEAAKIYFKNGAVLRGGVVTFTEVFTYSLESLIGTIGGTCGIWISVGVLTLIQMIMFFIQFVLRKGLNLAKATIMRNCASAPVSELQSSSNVVQTSKI